MSEKRPKKQRAKAPANENKQQKLVRLAVPRVNRCLKALDSIARLRAYGPSEEQVAAIVNSLSSKIAEVKAVLAGSKSNSGFTLPQTPTA